MAPVLSSRQREREAHGRDQSNTGQRKLPAGTPAVWDGGGKETGYQHGYGPKNGNDRGESLQLPSDTGKRSCRDVWQLTIIIPSGA